MPIRFLIKIDQKLLETLIRKVIKFKKRTNYFRFGGIMSPPLHEWKGLGISRYFDCYLFDETLFDFVLLYLNLFNLCSNCQILFLFSNICHSKYYKTHDPNNSEYFPLLKMMKCVLYKCKDMYVTSNFLSHLQYTSYFFGLLSDNFVVHFKLIFQNHKKKDLNRFSQAILIICYQYFQ